MPEDINFRLRPGKPEERGARFRLVEQAWRSAYRHIYALREIDGVFDSSISSYGDWSDHREKTLETIAAEANGLMIGFISLARLRSAEGEVSALYVLPEYQGKGVGTALWKAGCARLRALGYSAVWVWTIARADAVHFYEHQGCLRAGTGSYEVGEHNEPAVGFRLILKDSHE
jgi:GNAT superfamily N-acetyltransferase